MPGVRKARGLLYAALGGHRNVLEPHLAAGDLLPVRASRYDHLPELLDLALDNRLGEDVGPSLLHRAQEVCVVTNPHCELSTFLHRGRSSHTGCALHCRGIDTTVHHAPGRMVVLAQFDRTANPAPADFLEVQAGDSPELTHRNLAMFVGYRSVLTLHGQPRRYRRRHLDADLGARAAS